MDKKSPFFSERTKVSKRHQRICVLGLGYIGLPTASILATKGFNVLGVDVLEELINNINNCSLHVVETDLDILVKSAIHSKHLRASLYPEKSDIFIIAVPTPFKESSDHNKIPDISYVEQACQSIIPVLEPGNLVILESTSPVGTTEHLVELIYQAREELKGKIFAAHCPERVLPGQILKELVENDRIIGGLNPESAEKAKELYQSIIKGNIYLTDLRTAELSKLVENAFRDVNIAFANELSIICDHLKINVWELIKLANRHPRVNILQPGPGVGGHCLAVDPWFIVDSTPEKARLIKTAREINDYKPRFVVEQIKQKMNKLKDPVITCLGLAFKADVDDIRESPAVEVVYQLASEYAGDILVVEPYIETLPPKLKKFNNIHLVDLKIGLEHGNLIVLLVNHRDFSSITPGLLEKKEVVDTRGVLQ